VSIWIIEPHDPLIFRDGRPFGPTPGARASSLPFPFPSTLAGAVRTQAGLDGQGRFRHAKLPQETAEEKERRQAILKNLKQLRVRGPFLVEHTKEEPDEYSWLLPAPHDALLFEVEDDNNATNKKKRYHVKQLVPLELPERALTDLGELPPHRMLAGLPLTVQDKASEGKAAEGPLYWHWDTFKDWLIDPSSLPGDIEESKIGHKGPERELRVHIAMNPERGAAKDEALFDTSGMEFTHHDRDLHEYRKMALAVIVDEENTQWELRAGLGSLGGERRLIMWRQGKQISSFFSEEMTKEREKIVEEVANRKCCRIVLLTPAYFQQGYEPCWLLQVRHGVEPTLRTAVVKRPQVVSGWDIDLGAPKPSLRLAPAGSVFYLSLNGSDEAIRRWVREMWLQSISDDQPEQYRNDGFGVAIVGTWSGTSAERKE
jgi:CRISPR-associated protein Cmr3